MKSRPDQEPEWRLAPGHTVRQSRSPINITVRCSCGWSHTQTRRQNALARAAKIRAAVYAHDVAIRDRGL